MNRNLSIPINKEYNLSEILEEYKKWITENIVLEDEQDETIKLQIRKSLYVGDFSYIKLEYENDFKVKITIDNENKRIIDYETEELKKQGIKKYLIKNASFDSLLLGIYLTKATIILDKGENPYSYNLEMPEMEEE